MTSSASGLNLSNIDPTISPKDDLYKFANGKWLAEAVIPSDKTSWGTFSILNEKVEGQIKELLEEIFREPNKNHNQQLITNIYDSYMNENLVKEKGLNYLPKHLKQIEDCASLNELFKLMGELQLREGSAIVNLYTSIDNANSKRALIHLSQGGTSLPDKSYYLEPKHETIRDHYVAHIERLSNLANHPISGQIILEHETNLARIQWDAVQRRDVQASYNLLKTNQLLSTYSELPLLELAQGRRFDLSAVSEVVVRQPSFLKDLSLLILQPNMLTTLKQWLQWRLIAGNAPYLSEATRQENFDFWGKKISGLEEMRPRWKYAKQLVEAVTGDAIGQEYVKKHYAVSARASMSTLIANLVEAFRLSMHEQAWLTPATKDLALVKLGKFKANIGYPSQWEDYSNLVIEKNELITDVLFKINEYLTAKEWDELFKPIDPEKWYTNPQTVNAYYAPNLNSITFPAGILQPPFFDPSADDALNYGAIGAIIGHEIGHGFDDQGSKFDGDGNLESWWEDVDQENFVKLGKKLISQYSALAPELLPHEKVNGELTLGENIGDLVGLSIAFKAYLLSSSSTQDEIIDGFTGPERFFLGWAQAWCTKHRKEALAVNLATDPHAPAEFRCNQIVRNLESFHEVFKTTPNDALYLPIEDRVTIW